MERPNVPVFGNWDKEEEVPYTIYFDKARKGRGGKKMINPNDPEENPDLFAENSLDRSRSRGSNKGSIHESPSHQRRGSNYSNRPKRQSLGSDRSFDQSPLHPQSRGKATGGAVAGNSPARDINKSPHHHSNQGNRTPGVTRMKPNSKDHGITPEKGDAVIPPFGHWNDKDPDSAENYTEIFNKASKDRQTGSAPTTANSDPSNYKIPKQKPVDQGCSSCFGWFKK